MQSEEERRIRLASGKNARCKRGTGEMQVGGTRGGVRVIRRVSLSRGR